jgi:copper chaperone CopZ
MSINVSIAGMSCENCQRHVQEALAGLDGVTQVEVSLEAGTADVRAGLEVTDEQITEALDEEGYDVTAIARG